LIGLLAAVVAGATGAAVGPLAILGLAAVIEWLAWRGVGSDAGSR
jgi:hypothetical protein